MSKGEYIQPLSQTPCSRKIARVSDIAIRFNSLIVHRANPARYHDGPLSKTSKANNISKVWEFIEQDGDLDLFINTQVHTTCEHILLPKAQ
jgi:hypothetical protein